MATDPGDGGDFERIDPKLTIYALANGMDLVKEPGVRRLGWYRDGREREVSIARRDGGGFQLAAAAFRTGKAEDRAEARVAEADTDEDLLARLSGLLDTGQQEANRL